MVFLRLDSMHFKVAISEFNQLLCEAVGPYGKIHLLQSAGGHLVVTSSSRRLLSNIVFDNPVLQSLVQAIESHINRFEDGGLYCGILLCTIYYNMLLHKISFFPMCHIFASFRSMLLSELWREESPLHVKVSLDSVTPLIIIAKSVLWSKPIVRPKNYILDPGTSDLLPILLVRGFLDAEGLIGRIHLNVSKGSHRPQLLHGVLYTCVDEHNMLLNSHWESVPIILVSTMLSDEKDANEKNVLGIEEPQNGEAQLMAAQALIYLAASCGIQVIACQRVIHPSLLLEMKRHGILALQRMGSQLTEAVQALSGATPISSLKSLTANSLICYKGCLGGIKYVELAGKNYLLMESSTSIRIQTLFVSSTSAESTAELEVVARQTLRALKQAVEDRILIPGAGCSEMFLCSFLSSEINHNHMSRYQENDYNLAEFRTAASWLQLALLNAAGLDSKRGYVAVDSIFHHAWKSSDQEPEVSCKDACYCGLVSSSDVFELKGRWQKISAVHGEPLLPVDWCHCPQPTKHDSQEDTSGVSVDKLDFLFDVVSSKCNAVSVAIDSCLSLSNVGAVALTEK